MAIRPVLRMGDPRLLERSKAVRKFRTAELSELITDMKDTMASLNGAGLAAPAAGSGLAQRCLTPAELAAAVAAGCRRRRRPWRRRSPRSKP